MPKAVVSGQWPVVSAGEVLTGKTSVEMALYLSAIRAVKDWSLEFARPEDYDPVLRAHCRFDREG